MNENNLIENMIRWAEDRLGETGYAGWCLSFVEDALEIPNGIEIFGGDSAQESAVLYADAMQQGEPERVRSSSMTASAPGRPARSTGATAVSASEPAE